MVIHSVFCFLLNGITSILIQIGSIGVTHIVSKEVTSGLVITFPIIIAILAFISSILSIFISLKVKDKEYKNDYYKKVIDKRIKAIECAECFISLFSTSTVISDSSYETKKHVHNYLSKEKDGKNIIEMTNEVASFKVWYSNEANVLLASLIEELANIYHERRKLDDPIAITNFLISKYESIQQKIDSISSIIANDMRKLYRVDEFFKAKNK